MASQGYYNEPHPPQQAYGGYPQQPYGQAPYQQPYGQAPYQQQYQQPYPQGPYGPQPQMVQEPQSKNNSGGSGQGCLGAWAECSVIAIAVFLSIIPNFQQSRGAGLILSTYTVLRLTLSQSGSSVGIFDFAQYDRARVPWGTIKKIVAMLYRQLFEMRLARNAWVRLVFGRRLRALNSTTQRGRLRPRGSAGIFEAAKPPRGWTIGFIQFLLRLPCLCPTVKSIGPSPVERQGLCLLSLDGGGVRGLSSLYILKCIMDLVNSERSDNGHVKPCDVFDLIGGTSTGGLIAIMLGRLEMDVDECIESYRELMESVFSDRSRTVFVDWSGNVKAQYDSNKLRAAIEHVITRAGHSPDELLNDGKPRHCKVFVCTTAKETLEVTRLRSYDALDENGPSPTICEAALATSAATRYFDPVYLGDRQFVDGAFGANNPVEEVEEEACDIWCPSSRNLQELVKCLVSIGTGHAGKQAVDDNIFKFLSKTLVRMATKPAGVERRFMARWRRECEQKRCFRFNVEEGLQEVKMTEYQKQSLIQNATQDYLHHPTQKTHVRDCMLNLARKKGKTNVNFSGVVQAYNIRKMQIQIEADISKIGNPILTPKSPSWLVPFDRNPSYVDREILETIKQGLFASSGMSKAAVYGLGGVGKTQIALEMAYQAQEDHPDCSVFWVPAMSSDSIQQAYLKMADHLGIVIANKEQEEINSAIRDRLSQRGTGRWLLIFDNADDIEMWESSSGSSPGSSFKDSLPHSPTGRILFTTRSIKLAQGLAAQRIFHLSEMDHQGGMQMLQNLLTNKELLHDQEMSRKLLERLTYLPLAIAQAAAFINQNMTRVQDYIALLDGQEQDAIDLLSEDFEDKGRYKSIRNPVATTWLTSFEQIQKHNQLASWHLSLMACLSYRDIPLSLLPCPSKVEQERAIGSLRAYSLVRLTPGSQHLILHRLVHLAMRNLLRLNGLLDAWEEHTSKVLCRAIPPPDPVFRDVWRDYLPHILHHLDTTSESTPTEPRIELQYKSTAFLMNDARYREAQTMIRRVIKYKQEEVGPAGWQTLHALGLLGIIYECQSRFEEARELHTQVLQTKLQVLGPDHDEIALTLVALGLVHYRLAHDKVAEWLLISGIKGLMKHRGLIDRQTRAAISCMTFVYMQQGRLINAAQLAQQLHSLTLKACGPDNQDTLASASSLSTLYTLQGHWKQAEALCAEIMEKNKKLLGSQHPATVANMETLSWIMGERGRNLEAAQFGIEAARELERRYGSDHQLVRQAYARVNYFRNAKPIYERFVDRVVSARKTRTVMTRRKRYPRVRLCGGLWCPRRQINDDSLIRVIQTAAEAEFNRTSTPTSNGRSEITLSNGPDDEWIRKKDWSRFEFPGYFGSRTPEPQFTLGGGLFC
ncbi:Acyl transferase/acyl hydrolase/lysophospholipase [Penicillium hispanicum]|uniref:Acyl transferase/acyl hydrolase/lysophospholipase n=1 Tax=Penicillium hispanicum TaxID=1080232 RepID=UPI002540BF44|nr:Acyl transferase/acyl hydrolase/lysophospholipase [Penicillium hispanicum]KAJ5592025.1 Acyl transferase/acyl hydrolase/lysophospholipase [Penicillium hispanicum]